MDRIPLSDEEQDVMDMDLDFDDTVDDEADEDGLYPELDFNTHYEREYDLEDWDDAAKEYDDEWDGDEDRPDEPAYDTDEIR